MRAPRGTRRGAGGLLLVVLGLSLGCGGGGEVGEAGGPVASEEVGLEVPVDLYFPGPGGRLYTERRDLAATDGAEGQTRAVVEALLAGPEGEELVAPFPDDVEIGALYLTGSGVAYVDLRTDGEPVPPPPSGSTGELQRVFSLVNSIALNIPEVDRVVLLWNGVQLRSFAGHLDTARPLAPSTDMVAR